MKGAKARVVIYELAGIYLLYLAYQMFQNRAASTGSEFYLVIAFIGIFLLLGLGFLGAGLWIAHKSYKEDKDKNKSE